MLLMFYPLTTYFTCNSLYPCELEMKDTPYFETYSDILLEKDVTGGNLITKLYDKSYDF